MILSDFHMHSEFSSDSDASMEDMIKRAIQLGLKQICFTDHMDYDYPKLALDKTSGSEEKYLDFLFDANSYMRQLNQLKNTYAEQIEILAGVELGLQKHIQPQVKQLMAQHDFDFIIGSSHLLYGDDPYYATFWQKLRNQLGQPDTIDLDQLIVKKAIRDYFENILQNIALFPWFQVYGHLDYIVRYAPCKDKYYHVEEYMDIVDAILKELISQNRGIELNTSGLKSGLKTANPHTTILKRYRELGGEIITIGSDAHSPSYIAYEFDRAKAFLLECNFKYYTTFKKKQPQFHAIN